MASSVLKTKDTRKFVNDSGSNLPLVVRGDNNNSQGNFKDIKTAVNWANYNSSNSAEIVVRGSTVYLSDTLTITSSKPLTIRGDGATVECTSTTTIGSNITFKDLTFLCTTTTPFLVTGSNVKFINCIFNWDSISYYKAVQLNNCTNVEVSGCTFNYMGVVNPVDLVNAGPSPIYATIGSSEKVENVTIKDNIFNYVPSMATSDRPPFIYFSITSQSAKLRNIKINDNRFYNPAATASSGALEDRQATIAILASYTSGSNYPVLTNIQIEGNYCDNKQLIIVSGSRSGSPSAIRNAIPLKNVSISKNNVGAIGFYSTADSEVIAETSGGYVLDKIAGLTVSENAAIIIATMNERGYYYSPYDVIGTGSYSGVKNLGNVLITKNRVSYIHCAAGENLIINTNLLHNAGVSEISPYVDTKDTAIYVAQKSGGSGNCFIDNNSIDSSVINIPSFGSAASDYLGTVINVLCNATITNNIISLIRGTYIGINVGGKESVVSGNKLYRSSENIAAYIKHSHPNGVPSGSVGTITNNYFDSSTIDGTNEAVCNSIPYNWIYEANKNQTAVMLIPLWADDTFASVSGTSTFTLPIATGASTVRVVRSSSSGLYLAMGQSSAGPGDQIQYDKYISLEDRLPRNVTVLEAKMGAYLSASIDTDIDTAGDNSINLQLVAYKQADPINSVSSPDVLDVKTYLGTETNLVSTANYSFDSIGGIDTLMGATQYITLTVSSSDYQYTTTNNSHPIGLDLEVRMKPKVSSTAGIFLRLSPIRVKYKW